MKYTVERTDGEGKLIAGYKEEIEAAGAYHAFMEWLDCLLKKVETIKLSENQDTERFHALVTELEGKKRAFYY